MKLIISPAKKMNVDTDTMEIRGLPRFLDRTRLLCDWLKTMSYDQLKALWRCNDAIASLNYERLQHMELEERLTPAVLAYEGIQYRYMAPHLFSWEQFDYLDRHLRILGNLPLHAAGQDHASQLFTARKDFPSHFRDKPRDRDFSERNCTAPAVRRPAWRTHTGAARISPH